MRHLIVTALAVSMGCGGAARSPGSSTATAPAAPAAVAARTPVVPPLGAELNLDFEQRAGDLAAVWRPGERVGDAAVQAGYQLALDGDAHGGAASLRLRATGTGEYGSALVELDATPLRGKRVALHGWIKSDGVAEPGWAAVWLRVDDARVAFDNLRGRGVTGTRGWTEVTAQVDVPADAQRLALGPLLVGAGSAWFDDLRLEVGEVEPERTIAIGGAVVDPTGAPIAGATVALLDVHARRALALATSGADGRFRFSARPGAWALSARHASAGAGFLDPVAYRADVAEVRITLDAAASRTVRGVVKGAPPGLRSAIVAPTSASQGDLFPVVPDAAGRFEVQVPRAELYNVTIEVDGVPLTEYGLDGRGDADLVTVVPPSSPPAPEVDAWVAASAHPLVSAEAGHGFDDMAAIGTIVGKARVVGLGEASHGIREFFQLKHRVLEYLVAEHGFTVFAIEANLTECRAINAYVLRGEGDPRAALDGIHFWIWNTEEVLAMIEWMRAWNADPAHPRKLQFVGIDPQYVNAAYASTAGFLRRIAPREADALLAPIAVMARGDDPGVLRGLDPAARKALVDGLAALAARLDRSARAWTRAVGRATFEDARDDVRVLRQAAAQFFSPGGGYRERDLAMADNVDAALRRSPRGTRMVIWAHNGHVFTDLANQISLGSHLRRRYGRDYVVLGFAFAQGGFQARDWSRTRNGPVRTFEVGPARPGDAVAPFVHTGRSLLVLDLRRLPAGPVADWFGGARRRRDLGCCRTGDDVDVDRAPLAGNYDAVIYVERTTPSRPLPGGLRPHRLDE